LSIQPDSAADFRQWFHFRVSGVRGRALTLRILNAGQCSYPPGWQGYSAVCSEDGEQWWRTDTEYDGAVLTIRVTPTRDALSIAYFAPYSMDQHRRLIERAGASARVSHAVVGDTLDGRPLDLLTVGDPGAHKKSIWTIARQHPGESMAEWWMEGFVERLIDEADPVARALLSKAVVYVVPNMNPDGTERGHLRTNAAGENLNRAWRQPSAEKSPEVLYVRDHMHRTGVDFCMDVHGDEALPVNFLAGYYGIPDLAPGHIKRFESFKSTLARISPDFQTAKGYPAAPAGKGNMDLCTNYVAHAFKACAMTLEMPFKDTEATPDERFGWSPARTKHLARACVDALYLELGE
jgi:murein tripeptide amidase MpaA